MELGYGLFMMIVIGIFIVTIAKNINIWNNNNNAPRLNVTAKVVSKRTEVSHHNQANAGDETGAHGYTTVVSTRCYATFQTENGEQKEFYVSGPEYKRLAEGDAGQLTFQGTRYLSFEHSEN